MSVCEEKVRMSLCLRSPGQSGRSSLTPARGRLPTNTIYCLAQIQHTVWHKYNIMYGTNTMYCLVHIQHTVCHKYNILSGTTTIYSLAQIQYNVWHKYNILITVTTQGLPAGVPAVRISIHILIRKTCVHLLRSISIVLIAETMAQISLLKLDKNL